MDIKAMKLAKFLKRLLCAEGQMMATYHSIRIAYHSNNFSRIREILGKLKAAKPPFWSAQYHKRIELILLCEYLVVQNPKERKAALFRLRVTVDKFHELGRSIEDFLAEINNDRPSREAHTAQINTPWYKKKQEPY